MGLGAIDFALHCDRKPRLLVVTDITRRPPESRRDSLARVGGRDRRRAALCEHRQDRRPGRYIKSLTGGEGYNDVFVFAPVRPLVEMGDSYSPATAVSTSSPARPTLISQPSFNFYNVHYASTHIVGTSRGNTDDMIESLVMMSEVAEINPARNDNAYPAGLDSVADTIINLPNTLSRAAKSLYTQTNRCRSWLSEDF